MQAPLGREFGMDSAKKAVREMIYLGKSRADTRGTHLQSDDVGQKS